MGPIIDIFIQWKSKDVSPGHRCLVADESLLILYGYMIQELLIFKSLVKFW